MAKLRKLDFSLQSKIKGSDFGHCQLHSRRRVPTDEGMVLSRLIPLPKNTYPACAPLKTRISCVGQAGQVEYFLSTYCQLQACGGNPLIDAGADTEKRDTCRTDSEGSFCREVAPEGRQRRISLRDIHGLDDQQVIVE